MIKTSIETVMGKEVVTIFGNVLKINNTLKYQINYHE
jgi:putative transposon-encoded protein